MARELRHRGEYVAINARLLKLKKENGGENERHEGDG
jgi:hypothetical protein